jgi:preprotein translocase subunit SecE
MSLAAKPKDGDESLLAQLFAALSSVSMVKPNQGRVVRQVSFFAIAFIFGLIGWRMAEVLEGFIGGGELVRYAGTGLFILMGMWLAYRVINIPMFADFLIGVEAEMRKVTWPTNKELYRGSVVVLFVVVALAGLMFVFDLLWTAIFSVLRVR